MMTKLKKKAERKARKIVSRDRGRWLSNASMADATKIKKIFPLVIEGEPQETPYRSMEDLIKEGIVGLYSQDKKDEEIQ